MMVGTSIYLYHYYRLLFGYKPIYLTLWYENRKAYIIGLYPT